MSTEAIDRAATELAEARKAARAIRRDFARSPESAFVRVMKGVITQYLQARKDGVSRDDGIRGIEEELRAAWPKSVSKFAPNCQACEDTGWMERTCWDQQRCSRKLCIDNPERQHLYVVPCHCAKGDRFRPRQFTPEDAIAVASRTKKKKPGGWRQVGS